jgi:uncharacterized membrane protein
MIRCFLRHNSFWLQILGYFSTFLNSTPWLIYAAKIVFKPIIVVPPKAPRKFIFFLLSKLKTAKLGTISSTWPKASGRLHIAD